MGTNVVASVSCLSPFNTYFSTAFMPNFCGVLYNCFLGLFPPICMSDLFNSWSKLGTKKFNSLLLTAAAALLWAIWLTRNEVVFDRCRPKSLLQVLFRGTHWLRQLATA